MTEDQEGGEPNRWKNCEACGKMLLKKIVVQLSRATGVKTQLLAAEPLILHVNARPHIADVATKKLRNYGWEVLHYASYSPPDFDLFPKLKEPMRGRSFPSLEELSTDAMVHELIDTRIKVLSWME